MNFSANYNELHNWL